MPEIDMLAYTVNAFGEPEHAQRAAPDEAARYADRVPSALLRFWMERGRGAFEQGKFWICDPAPLQPVLDEIFGGDPELDPVDMTVVGYSAFGDLKVWHRRRRTVGIHLLVSHVFVVPESGWHDRKTGLPFSEDFSIGCQLTDFQYGPLHHDADGVDLLPQAIERQGLLAPGEIYGFVPALQLGGDYSVANLRRVQMVEHLMIVAQVSRFKLVSLTPPEPPAHPYGRNEVVRLIGEPK
jgi:hypothetical protein